MTRPDKLRTGYTTGACATAATKAALLALIEQHASAEVSIVLPAGQQATFQLHACAFTAHEASASVIKDAGDDPDVTHGAEICARVRWVNEAGIALERGPGVGLVTKKGLPVPPGEPAINPVPRRMLTETVQQVLAVAGQGQRGVRIELSIPGGAELAQKTYNPRLGIVGGLSILGTTGIVVPYSHDAWLASVEQGIDVAVAEGCAHVVLVVGAQGERAARTLFPFRDDAFIQMGPFFGAALRHCARVRPTRVSLVSMIGKLAKFASGQESVHSTASRQDFQFLADLARDAGLDEPTCCLILAANTAQETADLALDCGASNYFSAIADRARAVARSLVHEACEVEIVLVGRDGVVLARR
jgi:cobalt-precorrin-5B (C1)-methyltransferase